MFSRPRFVRNPGYLARLRGRGSTCLLQKLEQILRAYRTRSPAFFLAAQRAFMRAASFFRAAGLIGLRAGFLAADAAFLAEDLPIR
jgi:hypothetical protein